MRIVLAVAALLVAAPAAQAIECDNADTVVTASSAAAAQKALRCLINGARHDAGLKTFGPSGKLGRIARSYARRMRDEGFFGHTTPDGKTRAQRFHAAGYRHRGAENLSFGYDTPRKILEAWMGSSIHRGNVLSKRWRFIGVGVAVGGSRSPLWDVSFGHFRS